MAEHHKNCRKLYFIVAVLCIAAIVVFLGKVYFFGYSLSSKDSFYYQVDAGIMFQSEKDTEAIFSLAVPEAPAGFVIGLDKNGGYDFEQVTYDGLDRYILKLLPPVERRKVICRFSVVPAPAVKAKIMPSPKENPDEVWSDAFKTNANAIVKKIDTNKKLTPEEFVKELLIELSSMPRDERRKFAPHASGDETAAAAVAILNYSKIPARILRGVSLESEQRQAAQAETYVDVWFGNEWHVYRPNTAMAVNLDNFLVFQRESENSICDATGVKRAITTFSVTRVPATSQELNSMRAGILDGKKYSAFSLFSLPSVEQNTFKRLVLLPLAILIIVLIRNVVGVATMGTFMPVLIAMAFLEMRLLPGLINFVLILAVGMAIRAWLSHLNLLMVPRISAVVVVVIMLMMFISVCANYLKLTDYLEAAFFPIVIIAWTIERASTTWEEDGAVNTIKQLSASMISAIICYIVLANGYLQYVLYVFAEINLIVLGAILMLGTYTGYRLTELIRFKPLVKE